MSIEQKALKACRRYAELRDGIKAAGLGIGRHLDKCRGMLGTLQNWGITGEGIDETDETHLRNYFNEVKNGSSHHDLELAESAMAACPHCAAAHQLVQDRKRMRQQLGATKRFISKIGREEG